MFKSHECKRGTLLQSVKFYFSFGSASLPALIVYLRFLWHEATRSLAAPTIWDEDQ